MWCFRSGSIHDQGTVLPQPGAGEEQARGAGRQATGRVALHRHDGRLLRPVERPSAWTRGQQVCNDGWISARICWNVFVV